MARAKTDKAVKELKKKLFIKPTLVWDALSEKEKAETFRLGERYKEFLNRSKTEREAVREIVSMAESAGFREVGASRAGSKLFAVSKLKTVALAVRGRAPLSHGVRIVASHIDCPRLDLKQNPLYEDLDLSFLKTHYYGGIKKYQWVARPLALHGRVVLADGAHVDLCIGESPGEPVFTINDLPPHLSQKAQADKKMSDIVAGEKLNLLVGSVPFPDRNTEERFKLAVLEYLNRTYGIVEEDLLSAEIEAVPAGPAVDVGLDRGMVGAYGQDDRASAFASLAAMTEVEAPEVTCIAFFADKEEVGSEGPTSARSRFLHAFLTDVAAGDGGVLGVGELDRALLASKAISADVNPAMDPDWSEVHDKRNAARLGHGVSLSKFTGARGKVGSNDANAEYLGWLRRALKEARVVWHTGELGKVDEGGGGTIARFLAEHGMEVVDMGIPLLSMHSPFEISHKADLLMAYRAFKAFFLARS